MRDVFIGILNLSIVSSFLIIAVLLLRLALSKASKSIRYVLWAMVGLRLSVPYTIESKFSLIPNAQRIDSNNPSSTAYIGDVQQSLIKPLSSQNTLDIYEILGIVWLVGVALMLLYMVFSFVRVHRMVRERVKLRDNIYQCDHIKSPFVLGIFSPKIYVNSAMSEEDCEYIIAHEQAHIRHRDHIIKPIGFILLCVYWFNPLCWLSYFLFVKDIELFCDESVIKTLDADGKKAYSSVLLKCSSTKNVITSCPLAFSENDVKHRIKSVLSYKKPALYIVIISVVLCAIVFVMFMTNPVSAQEIFRPLEVEPTTQVETQAPTQPQTEAPTEPPTEKPTQEPTEPPTEAVEVYYDDSYYDDNYYVESEPESIVPYTMSEPTSFDWYGYGYSDSSISEFTNPKQQNNPLNEPIVWDYNGNGNSWSSGSSGVQRADRAFLGLN